MRILLAFLLATSSLLRPSLVLCLEPTGDVRVELQEAICCEAPGNASDPGVDAEGLEDCDGCLDVLLATHSLASKRAPVDTPLLPIAFFFRHGPDIDRVLTSTLGAGLDAARTRHFSRISTTVIRC